jgi:hypothetical protein
VKIISVLFIVGILSVAVAKAEDCSVKGPACDARASLAYEYLHARLGDKDEALYIWIHDLYTQEELAYLVRRGVKLNKLEAWTKTLKPEDRRAYQGWIDDYRDGLREAETEVRTHNKQKEQAEYSRHLRECEEAARKLAASQKALPRPPEGLLQ